VQNQKTQGTLTEDEKEREVGRKEKELADCVRRRLRRAELVVITKSVAT
jgi:hypothetical protein